MAGGHPCPRASGGGRRGPDGDSTARIRSRCWWWEAVLHGGMKHLGSSRCWRHAVGIRGGGLVAREPHLAALTTVTRVCRHQRPEHPAGLFPASRSSPHLRPPLIPPHHANSRMGIKKRCWEKDHLIVIQDKAA